MANSPAPLTWLQAAEQVLREEGPEMHIKDLTSRILEQGIVKSSCATSLETLLYRQTSGGPQGRGGSRGLAGPSKFIRVAGKHGWFGLKQSVLQEESDLNVSLGSVEDILMDDKNSSERDLEMDVKSVLSNQQLKRRNSTHSSDDENDFYVITSEGEESSDDIFSSSEASTEDDTDTNADDSLYRKKYAFLKKLAKSIIFENAALADQLAIIGERIRTQEVEREFLFRKLVEFEKTGMPRRSVMGILPSSDFTLKKQPPPPPPPTSSSSTSAPKQIHRSFRKSQIEQDHLQVPSADEANAKKMQGCRLKKPSVVHSKLKKENSPLNSGRDRTSLLLLDSSGHSSGGEWSVSEDESSVNGLSVSHSNKKNGSGSSVKKKTASKNSPEAEMGGDGAEELELAMRSGKVRRLHPIPLNKDGSPVFPIVVGGLKVLNLGKIICDRVAYHSERYLLPVGFESQRTYPSMSDPSLKCSYTCRILDGGEAPLFEMVADDDVTNPIRASSSTACQSIVLKNINKARDKQATNSGSGPEFFGYSNPTILNLLQKMPEAKKCPKYKFVRFAEPSRRGGGGGGGRGGGWSKSASGTNVRKLNTKSKILMKAKKAKKSGILGARRIDPMFYSGSAKESKPQPQTKSSPAIAPVFGTGQYGMDMTALSDSSSNESSSASDNELVIDS